MTPLSSIEVPVRRIDVGGLPSKRAKAGNRPILVWVPIRHLVIDPVYQRPILKRGWRQIEQIAEHFDWRRFTPILVSTRPDGTYAIVDGQHRAHAALLAGHTEVPAMVAKMSKAEEAAAFGAVNTQVTAITPFQLLKSAIAAGEKDAILAFSTVREAGCVLMTYNKSAAQRLPGEVFAVSLVRQYVQKGRADVVGRALSALRKSNNDNRVAAYQSTFLAPWFRVVDQVGVVSDDDLRAFWNGVDLAELTRRVERLRERESGVTRAAILKREMQVGLAGFIQ